MFLNSVKHFFYKLLFNKLALAFINLLSADICHFFYTLAFLILHLQTAANSNLLIVFLIETVFDIFISEIFNDR